MVVTHYHLQTAGIGGVSVVVGSQDSGSLKAFV